MNISLDLDAIEQFKRPEIPTEKISKRESLVNEQLYSYMEEIQPERAFTSMSERERKNVVHIPSAMH